MGKFGWLVLFMICLFMFRSDFFFFFLKMFHSEGGDESLLGI